VPRRRHARHDFVAAGALHARERVGELVRDLAGASGVAIETGLVRYAGRFVCDGLISRLVHLGPSFRNSCSRVYSAAKAAGQFHVFDEA